MRLSNGPKLSVSPRAQLFALLGTLLVSGCGDDKNINLNNYFANEDGATLSGQDLCRSHSRPEDNVIFNAVPGHCYDNDNNTIIDVEEVRSDIQGCHCDKEKATGNGNPRIYWDEPVVMNGDTACSGQNTNETTYVAVEDSCRETTTGAKIDCTTGNVFEGSVQCEEQ